MNECKRNREIKFKGYSKDSQWLEGWYTAHGFILDPGGNIFLHDGMSWIPIEKKSFRQYTGLKDKNGKEIYEGDIVHTGNYKTKIHRIQTVISDPECSSSLIFEPRTGASLCKGNEHIFEIIGNIYENPELLETD